MLQQARQSAGAYVGDACHSTKKVGTVHATCEHKHEYSHRHKCLSSGPNGCVSDELERLEKNDSYQYEQDRECDGDELFAVKGKGEGGFKLTCFKCGMRGHEADRCLQKGKGKGGKERLGDRKRWMQRKGDGPREIGQIPVTRGTILASSQLARQNVWLNLFVVSVQSV